MKGISTLKPRPWKMLPVKSGLGYSGALLSGYGWGTKKEKHHRQEHPKTTRGSKKKVKDQRRLED